MIRLFAIVLPKFILAVVIGARDSIVCSAYLQLMEHCGQEVSARRQRLLLLFDQLVQSSQLAFEQMGCPKLM